MQHQHYSVRNAGYKRVLGRCMYGIRNHRVSFGQTRAYGACQRIYEVGEQVYVFCVQKTTFPAGREHQDAGIHNCKQL